MKNPINFASDNHAPAHPQILKALQDCNIGNVHSYGNDPYTAKAIEQFKNLLGHNIHVSFVFNGTAANVIGLQTITKSFNAIICAANAHINVAECAATEKHIGCKLLTIETPDNKITVDAIKKQMIGLGEQHVAQPKVISITQCTELGTVYTPQEIRTIADFAHANNMLLHMDGARIANAVAHLNVDIKDITTHAGVDILSFGGTKNGLLYGEAIIMFNPQPSHTHDIFYLQRQGLQVASKMRFIAAQFSELLTNNLWLSNAQHANKMAQLLADGLKGIPQIKITQKVQTNGVFAIVPKHYIAQLQEQYYFYVWDEAISEVRWMTAFNTQEEDVHKFVEIIRMIVKG
jgi:threonine aldolase